VVSLSNHERKRFIQRFLREAQMREKIVVAIREAMVDSCNDMLNFTDEPSKAFNAEYLFTVNLAKAIQRQNCYHADPFTIYLERDAMAFAHDCLKPVVFGHPLKSGMTRFRKSHRIFRNTNKDIRNGRIDISVYYEAPNNGYMGKQPLCAIEVKGFKPRRTLVIADLKRNLKFHRVSGSTGDSVLQLSMFAALHSFPKVKDDIHIDKNVGSLKSKYESWLSELGDISDVEHNVSVFTVSKELVGRVLDEGEYMVLDTDSRHHFVGCIVLFERKKPNNSFQQSALTGC
jgi:hypothetical protein